ncbi:MAG: hypothetical protein ACI9TP_001300 [Candidatus Azotimanducaceae bacterium]
MEHQFNHAIKKLPIYRICVVPTDLHCSMAI